MTTLPRTHEALNKIVREAVEAREKQIAEKIMEAKHDHGLCEEVENFLAENDLDRHLPQPVVLRLLVAQSDVAKINLLLSDNKINIIDSDENERDLGTTDLDSCYC